MYVYITEIGDVGLVIPQFKDVEFVHPVVKIIQVDLSSRVCARIPF